MASLPHELLAMVFDECADDPSALHSCILVNRDWCAVALQRLWAKPFTLLFPNPRRRTSRSVNLIITFIECFTDIKAFENTMRLCKKYSKKFPFDYSLYLKEICCKEIFALTRRSTRFDSDDVRVKIIRLAIKYCPNLKTLSLKGFITYQGQLLISIKSLPRLQTLALHSSLSSTTFNTLSRVAKNLKSISFEIDGNQEYNLEQELHHGLQKLIQSQHRLKTITIKYVTAKMG